MTAMGKFPSALQSPRRVRPALFFGRSGYRDCALQRPRLLVRWYTWGGPLVPALSRPKQRSVCRWPPTSNAFRVSPCKGIPCTRNARDFSPYISSCKSARLRTHFALTILGAATGGHTPSWLTRPNLGLAPNYLIQVAFQFLQS